MESTFITRNPLLVVLSCLLVAFFSAHPFFSVSREPGADQGAAVVATPPVSSPSPFDGLDLEARAVYVWDSNSGRELYAKNAQAQLPLASLTKIMTAMVALDRAPRESVITIKKEFLKNEGDQGLRPAEAWRLKDMIQFMLVASSNDGADAVASAARAPSGFAPPGEIRTPGISFIDAMNAKAKAMGLTQTYFTNDTGLDRNKNDSGAYGSARDVVRLFTDALAVMPDLLEATRYKKITFTSLNTVAHTALNTNPLVSNIPGLIASKTGYTDLAGGNVVIAFDAGPAKPIVIALLGSSADGRFKDMQKLVWASLQSIDKNDKK